MIQDPDISNSWLDNIFWILCVMQCNLLHGDYIHFSILFIQCCWNIKWNGCLSLEPNTHLPSLMSRTDRNINTVGAILKSGKREKMFIKEWQKECFTFSKIIQQISSCRAEQNREGRRKEVCACSCTCFPFSLCKFPVAGFVLLKQWFL